MRKKLQFVLLVALLVNAVFPAVRAAEQISKDFRKAARRYRFKIRQDSQLPLHISGVVLSAKAAEKELVVFKEDQPVRYAVLTGKLHQLLDQSLTVIICRVSFTGKDELYRSSLIGKQPQQPVAVTQQKCTAFVSGKAAGKTDGQNMRIKDGGVFFRIADHAFQGFLQPLAGVTHQTLAAEFVSCPQFVIRNLIQPLTEFFVFGAQQIIAGQIVVKKCPLAVGDP